MQNASSPDNVFHTDGKDGQVQFHDDLAAFFDWNSFDSDAPQPLKQANNDVKPAASQWPPSRLSGESSACVWDENSPRVAEHVEPGLPTMGPPPPQQQLLQQQSQQQPQQGGFETAWAAAHAAPHSQPWAPSPLQRGGSQTLAPPQPLLVSYDSSSWQPQQQQQQPGPARQFSQDMSWSLSRGLAHPAPQRMVVHGDAYSGGGQHNGGVPTAARLPPSHPLAGQLSGTYPSAAAMQDYASLAQQESQGRGTGVNSPFYPGQQQQQQASNAAQHVATPHHQMYYNTNGSAVQAMNSTAALKQLTEDELRRHVQQQVMSLIQIERDQAQLGWLHELLEMTKTSALPLLGTLRQQLDVLLQPSAQQPQQRAAPVAATSPYSDGWQSILNQATAVVPMQQQQQQQRHGGATHAPALDLSGGGSEARRSLSALPASAQHQQQLQRAAGGSGQHSVMSRGGGVCTSPSGQRRRSAMANTTSFMGGGSQSVQNGVPSGVAVTDEIGSHCTVSARKRGAAASEGEMVDKRIKGEPSGMTAGALQFEPRWWRKQNNFTMTIDDIVKKMQGQGRLGPNGAAWQPTDGAAAPTASFETCVSADSTQHINADRVRQVYHKPLKEAAKLLSVSVMSLKRTCRKMGVRRWPYRKLASLTELEVTVRDDQLEQQLQPSDKEAVMQYIQAEKAAIMMAPDRDVDPLLSDLRKAKIHMKYEKWGRKSLSRGTSNAQSQAASGSVGGPLDCGGDDDAADDMM